MGLKDLFVKRKGEASVGLTKRTLKEWVDALPLLDLPRASVRLDSVLFRLTMSEYRDKSWYELLEQLFAPIGAISRLAYEKFNGDITTSRESQRAILYYIRQLHLHYGDNCYYMLMDNGDVLTAQQKSEAAFYALQSYSLVILRSYQLSMLIPKQVWFNFYSVYQVLHNSPIENLNLVLDSEVVYKTISPTSFFTSIIVMSILSPYKLEAQLLEDIYLTLNETLDDSILYKNTQDEQLQDYCFSLELDRAPSMYQFYNEAWQELMFINQKMILTKLNKMIDRGFKINKQLLKGLEYLETRQVERFDSVGQAKIISGVVNSYRFLYGQIDELGISKDELPEIFSYPDLNSKSWPVIIKSYKKSLATSGTTADGERRLMQWKIIDKSSTGVGLVSQESYPITELSVGNFVQLNILSEEKWCSGLIRWMHIKEGGFISLGLEFLARENIPVYLQSDKQQKQGYKSMAILGKYTFKPWPNLILITQGLSYQTGDSLSLITKQHSIEITLSNCLETTKNCKIFSFKTAAELF